MRVSSRAVPYLQEEKMIMNKFTRTVLATVVIAVPGFFGLNAAYASGQHSGGHASSGHKFEFGQPGKNAEVSRTIDITMKDNLFEPQAVSVKAGETIRFRVTNKGEFLHEFGLGTPAMHVEHRKQMATMMEHGMIEADRINREKMKMSHGSGMAMSHEDPNSILLEPKKAGEIVWKFTKPMKLEFACNVPGHYESGMMGDIQFK